MKKYKLVACGGTFDRLHQGHKDFLNFTINLGEKVVLGLTSDLYIKHYKNNLGVMPFEVRKKILEEHLGSIQKPDKVEIISIDDHFGPTLSTEYPFDCLAVTESTEEMGAQINVKREEKGIQLLLIEVFTLTLAEDGKPITSTRIRNGEIDREGKLYIKKEWLSHDLILPESLRGELSRPLGEIMQDVPSNLDSNKTITVGDMVTKTFRENKVQPFLSIIDFKTRRENSVWEVREVGNVNIIRVKSPAGIISSQLMNEILLLRQAQDQDDKSKKTVIVVDGEEDLTVLPTLLAFPLGYQVFYGQPVRLSSFAQDEPGGGIVKVIITEKIKDKVRALLEKFDIK